MTDIGAVLTSKIELKLECKFVYHAEEFYAVQRCIS